MSLSASVARGPRDLPVGRARLSWATSAVAALVAVLVAGLGGLVGFHAVDPGWAAESLSGGRGALAELGVAEILTRNLGAALLLYSGVATLGVSGLGGVVLTSVYVGATLSVGVHNSGPGALVSQTGLYLPLEMGGLLLAATAGLLPLVGTLLAHRDGSPAGGPVRRYLSQVGPSLHLLGLALTLITLGAVVESVVLATR